MKRVFHTNFSCTERTYLHYKCNRDTCLTIICYRLVETADRVFTDAESHCQAGDEEMAYMQYMKYFNIISVVKQSPHYSTNKVK